MDGLSIAKSITRAVLVTIVLAVIGFSLFVAPDLNGNAISMALVKGALTLVFGWIFILILSDTIVKSITASALEAQATRKDGGFIYHFLKPDLDEIDENGNKIKPNVSTPA